MATIDEECLHSSNIPYLYGGIIPCRSDVFTIRRPGHCIHPTGVPIIYLSTLKRVSVFYLPYVDRLIVAARGDISAVGRPCYRIHPIRMPTIGQDMFHTGSGLVLYSPHLHRLIVATKGKESAVGRPCKRTCPGIRSGRIAIGEEATSSGSHTIVLDRIPHLHGTIKGARGDMGSIG